MKKRTLLLSMVFVFALVAVVNNAAVAQDQSLHPQMQQNLHEMSAVMADISNQLSTGKMSPDAQKTAALIMKHASQILQELSGLGGGVHHGHKKKIEKMKKDWDPFAEEAATND
jgi:hypothetical protein